MAELMCACTYLCYFVVKIYRYFEIIDGNFHMEYFFLIFLPKPFPIFKEFHLEVFVLACVKS